MELLHLQNQTHIVEIGMIPYSPFTPYVSAFLGMPRPLCLTNSKSHYHTETPISTTDVALAIMSQPKGKQNCIDSCWMTKLVLARLLIDDERAFTWLLGGCPQADSGAVFEFCHITVNYCRHKFQFLNCIFPPTLWAGLLQVEKSNWLQRTLTSEIKLLRLQSSHKSQTSHRPWAGWGLTHLHEARLAHNTDWF